MKIKKVTFLAITLFSLVFQYGCAATKAIKVTDPRTGKEYTVDPKFNRFPGIEGLAKVCAEEAEQIIEKVVYAEGVYDSTENHCGGACISRLVRSDFNYLELNVTQSESYRALPSKGIWKVYKSNKNDSNCNKAISKNIAEYKTDPVKSFSEKYCLASIKQNEIESRYGVYFNTEYNYLIDGIWVSDDQTTNSDVNLGEVPGLLRQHEKIIDHQTRAVIGETITFRLFPRPIRAPNSISCITIDVNSFDQWTKQISINPKNDEKR